MAFHKFVNNFTAGEWTPFLDGRSDLEKYDNACRTLENMRPLPYGGARIRSGLKYIAAAKTADTPVRLIPFNFSTGTRFVIEMSDLYLRFYSNGTQVLSGGSPYQIASPYAHGQVFVVQFKQINDVMYLVHPSHPPYKLSRVTDTNWTLAAVDWSYPPLREENTTSTTLAAGATTGTGVALVASAALFDANHVGAYFEIRHLREGNSVELSLSATSGTTNSSALTVKGDWSLITTERWYGELLIERSTDGGSTWETVRKLLSSADRNATANGTETEECQLRLTYTATGDPYGASVWVGTAPTSYVLANAKLESSEAYASGLVKITAVTNSTNAVCTVVQTVASTAATDIWSEGAWSAYRGYPAAVGLFEQRMFYGATSERPTRFWGSKTGDFENFTYGEDDDAAVAFDIATTESNPIKWIESLQRIQIGTGGGEYAAASGSNDEPLTPSNISVRGQSAYGSGDYQPILVNDAVVFLQRQNRRLREMTYDIQRDGYVAPDLTLLAEHVTEDGFIQLAFARQPDPLILASNGGELAVCTYNREQNIVAWARYVIARTLSTDVGGIESVCSIYGSPADEIWCVVRVVVNGSQKRYVCRFADETESKLTAALLDLHVTGTLTNPWNGTISGLSHLEGETVRLVVAGAVIGDYTVASGAITVDVNKVSTLGPYVVGLAYTAKLQPMKMDIVMANGPSQGRTRRISNITIRFINSLGCKFGPSLTNLETVNFRSTTDLMDASAPLFTGDKTLAFNGGHDKGADLFIVQDQPLPFTVLGLSVKAEIFGD